MELLKTENLIKQYRHFDSVVTAVNRVSVRIDDGEFIAIVGPSGSGKTTLLNLFAGLDRPDSGRIFIRGKEITNMEEDELCRFRGKNMGVIFQNPNLIPYYTVMENILMPLETNEKLLENYIERFKFLISVLKLTDRLHHLPSEISGGQQQRVAIARALIYYPSILFADELTGNLDRDSADEVLNLLIKLKNELSQTLIIVTHDPALASKANRVLHINNGEIVKITANNYL